MLRLLKSYWFLAGMALVLLLARYFPEAGDTLNAHKGPSVAIILLFIMSGMSVSLAHLHADLTQWKYHALIAGYVFGFIPLTMFLTSKFFDFGDLTFGIYLVAALPTTISSAIAFTTAAGGSTPTAIISAVGGNLLAVVLSPVLIGLMIGRADVQGVAAAAGAIKSMCVLVLIPFAAGQLAGRFTAILQTRYRKAGAVFSQVLVLFLMYCAFSKNLAGVLAQLKEMAACFVYLAVMLLLFVVCAVWMIRLFRMPRDKGAAVLFCSTQKTLAFGLPLAYAYFGADHPLVGIYIVPLIFYYLCQMISSSLLLHWWLHAGPEEAPVRTVD
jgi:sodium/bile acid cotransporter 7